ncbi:hypothetical protein ABZP36_013365 [Zizania latifolia]
MQHHHITAAECAGVIQSFNAVNPAPFFSYSPLELPAPTSTHFAGGVWSHRRGHQGSWKGDYGSRVSCARTGDEHDFFRAAQLGDLNALGALLATDPSLAHGATLYDRLSVLHVAAANGRSESAQAVGAGYGLTALWSLDQTPKLSCLMKPSDRY